MNRLTQDVSHGYELIKARETLTQGGDVPGTGVIYPTIHYLQEQALSCLNAGENGRKTIAITPISQQWLEANRGLFSRVHAHVEAHCTSYRLRSDPQMQRVLDHFKTRLELKVNRSNINAKQLKERVGIINGVAQWLLERG